MAMAAVLLDMLGRMSLPLAEYLSATKLFRLPLKSPLTSHPLTVYWAWRLAALTTVWLIFNNSFSDQLIFPIVQPVAQQTFFDRVKPSLRSPVFTADLKYRASGMYNFISPVFIVDSM